MRGAGLRIRVFEVPGALPSASPRSHPSVDDDVCAAASALPRGFAAAVPPPPPVVVSDIPLERLLDREFMASFLGPAAAPISSPINSPIGHRSQHHAHHASPDAAGGRARSPSVSAASSPAAVAAPSPRVWIQLSGLSSAPATSAALKAIGAALRIHPVTVSDLQTSNTREKLEVFSEYLFMVVHAVVHPTPTIFDIVQKVQEEDDLTPRPEQQQHTAAKIRQRAAASASAYSASSSSYDPSLPSTDGNVNPFESDWHAPPAASSADFRSARVRTAPIHLVVFPHMVLSLHHGHQQSELNSVCRKLHSLAETHMESGQWIVHAIMDAIISSLRPIVDATDNEIDRLEQLIFEQTDQASSEAGSAKMAQAEMQASGQLLKRMGLTRRRLLMLQQQLKSKQSLINSLIGRDMSRLSSVQMPYLRDLEDHVADMQAIAEGGSTMLEALQSTYLSQLQLRAEAMSRTVNNTMKKLSAFATIVLPLSLISGIMGQSAHAARHTRAIQPAPVRALRCSWLTVLLLFLWSPAAGMNVEVPEQVWQPAEDGASINSLRAFWSIILVMLSLGLFMTWTMKRRGFLD